MKHQTMNVTEFKAKCLSIFEEIAQEGGTLTITKRGQPLATVGPVKRRPFRSSEGVLAGKIKLVGDLDKIDNSELWDVVRNPNQLEEILSPKKKR
jgi:antitoxin (DNA-binding transcriptional repressor) of toxin-antitoxin stability system